MIDDEMSTEKVRDTCETDGKGVKTSIYFDAATFAVLKQAAREAERSKSWMVRKAVQEKLGAKPEDEPSEPDNQQGERH